MLEAMNDNPIPTADKNPPIIPHFRGPYFVTSVPEKKPEIKNPIAWIHNVYMNFKTL